MKGVHHRHSCRQFLCRSGFEAGEPVHRDHLDPFTPGLIAIAQPGRERLGGAALDHVQQPSRATLVPDGGQVDDHGDELVAAAGVAPAVFVNPDHGDAVEPVRVLDQHPAALGQDGVVGGVPGHVQGLGDPCHSQMLSDQRLQRPAHRPVGQFRPRRGGGTGVLAPHLPALAASIPADLDLQYRWTPTKRGMRKPAGDRIPWTSFAPAPTTPLIRLQDPAGQHRPTRLQPLANNHQAEIVHPGESGQVRGRERSVRHVEVFRVGRVVTPIIGRPRPINPTPTRPHADNRLHPQIGRAG